LLGVVGAAALPAAVTRDELPERFGNPQEALGLAAD
jgi:hypothetical protein